MTSEKLNEILNKTRRTPDISLTPKQVKELVNDLEVLDILKKAFLNNGVDVKPKCKKCFNLLELEPSEWLKFRKWLEGDEIVK